MVAEAKTMTKGFDNLRHISAAPCQRIRTDITSG